MGSELPNRLETSREKTALAQGARTKMSTSSSPQARQAQAIDKILDCPAVHNVRHPLSTTRGANISDAERTDHDDDQAGDSHARDCSAGGRPVCCGSKTAQALQAPYLNASSETLPDMRTLPDGRSDDAPARNLWIVWAGDRDSHRSIGRNVLVAFGRRDQRTPDLEQHHAPLNGMGSMHSPCGGDQISLGGPPSL